MNAARQKILDAMMSAQAAETQGLDLFAPQPAPAPQGEVAAGQANLRGMIDRVKGWIGGPEQAGALEKGHTRALGYAGDVGDGRAISGVGGLVMGKPGEFGADRSWGQAAANTAVHSLSPPALITGAIAEPTTDPRPVENRLRWLPQAMSSAISALSLMFGKPNSGSPSGTTSSR